MNLYFSTVIRSAPTARGGELVKLDWQRKQVLNSVPIVPTNPDLDDPNPRGNTRGGRGIELLPGGEVLVCSYHSLRLFDRDLRPLRDLTHPLMASLHETEPEDDGRLWVTSTAIDAALLIDLQDGSLVRSVWPRELPGLQRALGLTPLQIDKQADNRALFLGSDHYRHPHHVHLNALARWRGELFGLFSKHGVIANLDRQSIVVADPALRGAHNLRIDDAGSAAVCHSLGRAVLRFDLHHGKRIGKLAFGRSAVVRGLARRHDLVYRLRRTLARLGLQPHTPPRPVFVRGLARAGDGWFVGISPATILQLDATGAVVDHFTWRRDVNACVHGLGIEA